MKSITKKEKCYHETSLGFCPFNGKNTSGHRPKKAMRHAKIIEKHFNRYLRKLTGLKGKLATIEPK